MINWTADKLKALGTTIELADVGVQTLPDGQTIPLPKVILGILGNVSVLKFYHIIGFVILRLRSKIILFFQDKLTLITIVQTFIR